jgi:hypothetical protein
MGDKEVVIIVPGAKYIKSRAKFMQKLILLFYRLTRIYKPVYHNYSKEWENKFNSKDRIVFWLHWSRGISFISKFFAKRRLIRLIKQYQNRNIMLVGISLGGEIILEVLQKIKNHSVKKVILICSTNENKNIKLNSTQIINIFSEKDLFSKFAIEILSPFHGGQKLYGKNIKNVLIPEMTHDEFCSDSHIRRGKYKGKSVTEIVNSYLID